MKQAKVISGTMSIVGFLMITIAIVLQGNINLTNKLAKETKTIDASNMAAATKAIVNKTNETTSAETTQIENKTEVQEETVETKEETPQVEEVTVSTTVGQSVLVPERIEVFEGLTLEELTEKLNRNMGSGYIAGKGNILATKCLELGIDPYVALAIMLHETGCSYNCSQLVRTCNNVGGQKGSPACSGSYKGYATLDEGIVGFVENLYRNYYAKGLTTVESIGPRYAQSTTWVSKINGYTARIRAN